MNLPSLYEYAEGKLHIPRYTEGCWGRPTEKQCYICKVRTVIAFFRVVRRTRKQAKKQSEENSE